MQDIKLIVPTREYEKEIWDFRQEVLEQDVGKSNQFAGCGTLKECHSMQEWLDSIAIMSSPETCPARRVPSHTYIAVRLADQKVVGITDLRHHIQHPVLGVWGGHIGYSVRPSERRKGYAKEMLRQNLENARRMGIKRVLITCVEENVASEKTIVANGGVFDHLVESTDGRIFKRFWIRLASPKSEEP